MEFEIKKNIVEYDFFVAGSEFGKKHAEVIKVIHSHVHPDFNPERTARMIEKMEEMFEFCLDYTSERISLPDFIRKWNKDGRMKSTTNYIEHGDKEETIECYVLFDNALLGRKTKIPKTEP